MDTTVQKCSGEVKQTPDCPLKRTQKNNLQPWRVLVATQFQFATVACACCDTILWTLIEERH